jgi:uncharacterized membrane protein YccC
MRSPPFAWGAELLRPKPARIPWALAVRTAVAVATPVGFGMAIGQLLPGILASIGALAGSLQDRGGPYRSRFGRVSIVAAAGAIGFLVGERVLGDGLLTAVVVLCAGLIAGFVSVLGNVASVASLQFLINVIVASSVDFGSDQWWYSPVLYLAGAAWALCVSLVGGIGRVTAPERAAVADVYRALAFQMELSGSDDAEAARRELTDAMNTAYDTVVTYRATAGGRDPRVRRLAALLNASVPLVETTVTLQRDRASIPLRVTAETREIAATILRGDGATKPVDANSAEFKRNDDSSPATVAIALSALDSGLAAVRSILFGARIDETAIPHRPTLRERASALRDAAVGGPETWTPILRLVLCLAAAQAVGGLLPTNRPYWVALTVAVTLKPDFGSVFSRAVQRGLGTMVGVVFGSALLVLLPNGTLIVLAIAVFAAMLPISIKRNYGMFTTFITPVIVLLLDLAQPDQSLVLSRLIDTAAGCAIVLLIGYLPWPSTWRSRARLGDAIAGVTDDVLAYLRAALQADHDVRRSMRRQAYRRLSDLRTVLQQALAEPPPVSTQASAWWPAIVALERLTDAATAVVVRSGLGQASASQQGIDQVIAFMAEFDAAVREHRRPADLPLPDEKVLSGVVGELRTAQAILTPSREDA